MIATILTVGCLLGIAYEDFKNRSVHIYWFIGLFGSLLGMVLASEAFDQVASRFAVNMVFCVLQLALLNVYFCLKERKWIWIFDRYLGWGDVVFIACVALLWDLRGFIIFTIVSIGFALLIYVIGMRKQTATVPLAGLQAIFLIILLFLEWINFLSLDSVLTVKLFS